MSDEKAVPAHKQVFLGSSHEASEHLDVVSEWLEDESLKPLRWDNPTVFIPGRTAMGELIDIAHHQVVGAVFLFAEDDLMHDGSITVPRDNVVLEYGLFAAALGEENTIVVVVGNPKLPSDFRAIYVDLDKQSRAKRKFKAWAHKLHERRREHSGLFSTYVDAALYTESAHDARAEILEHADDKAVIPGRYLYDNDVGTDHWVSLCKDRDYAYFHDGLNFWGKEADAFVAAIKEVTGHRFDFISLGPGNGQKDIALIRAWTKDDDLDVIYYPYDVSLKMLSQTVKEIRDSHIPIRLRAVLADFANLSQMETVFAARDAPNVISLLGNSLGNISDELSFVSRLWALMTAGDLLLLEVRLNGGQAGLAELERLKAKRFYFSPLEHYLAVKYDPDKVTSRPATKPLSKIPGAKSTLICYEDFEFDGETKSDKKHYSDVPLLCINEYDATEFMDAITKTGFEYVMHRIDDKESFFVCLMKRSK